MSKVPGSEFIAALLDPGLYPHAVSKLELIETHISWVILTGPFAYKIKKPVDYGFLDFSTLEKRKFYCEEEVRLNRRLAPEIYLEVIPVSRTKDKPALGTSGDIIEYAVKMKQFAQEAQLDRMLAREELHLEQMDAIAHMLSQFHEDITIADNSAPMGDPEQVWYPVDENFRQIREHCQVAALPRELHDLEGWSLETYQQLKSTLEQRKQNGFIRECHGDLHLRNLAWIDGKPLAFDCIEFNENLRWIDVLSEIAFLVMDLLDHEQTAMAHRLLNTYLEDTGDYAGLAVLPFYLVYRAMVRAKVAAIRLAQTDLSSGERKETEAEFSSYIKLAQKFSLPKKPFLMITHGMSGSGKSTLAQGLLEATGAIRIRSDVERKRLFGLKQQNRAGAEIGQGIYQKDATLKTYQKLQELADRILAAAYPVIVDATFQKQEQRQEFIQLAQKKNLPFMILECMASTETLRNRIRSRTGDASDADLQVLEHQLQNWQKLDTSERVYAIQVDTEKLPAIEEMVSEIQSRFP